MHKFIHGDFHLQSFSGTKLICKAASVVQNAFLENNGAYG